MKIEHYIQLHGALFEAVQRRKIFSDDKIFTDAVPKIDPRIILKHYVKSSGLSNFDLKRFVINYFSLPEERKCELPKATNMQSYIEKTWPFLLRAMDLSSPYSTLIVLPRPHIVPGGRFRECFYWDSYFVALGLLQCNQIDIVKDMVKNFAFLIDTFGFIPNGNRVYFTTRSQPPYFSFLLALLYEVGEKDFALSYLLHLEREYNYWMQHSICLNNGMRLNHYFDIVNHPRPEAYRKEVTLAKHATDPHFFLHVRAACASGWDFSSRWLKNPQRFETICTSDIIPIDLNCLLFHMEEILAHFFTLQGKKRRGCHYKEASLRRKWAIQTLFWKKGFFFDYHFPTQKHTSVYSIAAATPLFVKACTPEQADLVAKKLHTHFLLKGGFVTSLTETTYQWDMPNGWAPLEWITIQGLINYGHRNLACEGAKRWLALNEQVFTERGVLLEKYNVREGSAEAISQEYPLQQGFGWTNGVGLALMKLYCS